MRRLLRLLLALTLVGCATHAAVPAASAPNYVPDESNQELVLAYLTLPCELLAASTRFQQVMVDHEKNHFEDCMKLAETSDYKYAVALCGYAGMQWKFIYVNQKSVEKAFNIMCWDDSNRKNPEYEIHF